MCIQFYTDFIVINGKSLSYKNWNKINFSIKSNIKWRGFKLHKKNCIKNNTFKRHNKSFQALDVFLNLQLN